MVKALKGVLVTCDAAVKQIILNMNEKEPVIVQDLDDTHILIRPEALEKLKDQLEEELEKNTYTLE